MKSQKSLLLDISVVKDALLYGKNNEALYDAIINQFRECVNGKVGKLKDYLARHHPPLYEQVMEKWSDLSPRMDMHRCFLYPEVIHRLLNSSDYQDTAKFIVRTLDAELAKRDEVFDKNEYDYLWTSNGDFLLRYDEDSKSFTAFEAFRLNEVLPLDFFSPSCIKITAECLQEPPTSIIDEYNYTEAYGVYERIYQCLDVLDNKKSAKDIVDLIYKFTNVLVLKRQNYGLDKQSFFSSSDGFYVGRTVLGNAEIVSREMLVDSIVHESIHALLYMIDEKYQWQPSPAESDKLGRKILSPWSGNMLSVRNYLQAIFVWYGLFNLWKYALGEGDYDPGFARDRIELIRNGFLQVDINKSGKELDHRFDEALTETVIAIKEYVIAS